MSDQHDRAVFCTAEDRSKAISIVESLRASAFRESEISLIVAHEDDDGEIAIEGNETDEEVDRAKEIYKDAAAEHISVQEVVEVS